MDHIEYKTYNYKNYKFKYGSLATYELNNYIFTNTNEKLVVIKNLQEINPVIKFTNWTELKNEQNVDYSNLDFLVFDENTDLKVIFESFQYWLIQMYFDLLDDDDRLSYEEEEELKEAKKYIDPNKEFKNEYLQICQKLSIPYQFNDNLMVDQPIVFDVNKKLILN